MEANKKGFKGVWLGAAIYESPELSAVEKLLLAEIDALTTDTDACYASNAQKLVQTRMKTRTRTVNMRKGATSIADCCAC